MMSVSFLSSPQEEDGFVLPESCAILRYLTQRHKVSDHWYPGEFLSVPSLGHGCL